MSFEGFYQRLCGSGHYSTTDAYYFRSVEDASCPDCGGDFVWWNLVDETNGLPYNEETGETAEHYEDEVILEKKSEAVWEECSSCHHKKLVEEETYHIPNAKGHKVE